MRGFLFVGLFYRALPVPLLPGPIVEPLGEGFMLVVPDGLAPAFCAAPALPGALLMPTVPVEEPVALGVVDMLDPVALPVAPPVLVVCAIANVLVKASAVASASVVFLMNHSR